MGIQTIIDSFDLISPGFSSAFDKFGGTDYFNLRPTDTQEAGYYSAMALIFIAPGGAKAKVQQYSLRALEAGYYPVMKRGFKAAQELVWLEKDEIWKFGTTKNPFTRYSQKYLKNLGEEGVYYFKEFEGTLSEVLKLEKMKIKNYFERTGHLPWGNKINK
ncbi:hypothetical protein [Flavobacterium piscis]|uniref:Uncharacterized protein (DUF3820 family) n=1 Tax=Flavobacterium piscis TaxID=1114874 RepID=A0ABU1YH39_9FLAO|nr:hypothetical protein [Flavobacterium piscis]MDR7212731.1 uncharacterized protein (DUF3820 family) [Flavobacterium piscis]